jgi:Uma2 family endonuclease
MAFKTTPTASIYPDPVPPVWVIEVVSPTDKAADMDIRDKRAIYLKAGILY